MEACVRQAGDFVRKFESCNCTTSNRLNCFLSTIIFLAFGTAALGQATPSANSGINPQDTHAVFALTMSSAETIALPNAIYNPNTQTTSELLVDNQQFLCHWDGYWKLPVLSGR
jgi:hypothetical protein